MDLDLKLSDIQLDLFEGSFDLALRNIAMKDTSLKGRKLADDTRILCASPDYLRHHGTPTSPSELDKHHLLAFRDRLPRKLIGLNGSTATFEPEKAVSRLVLDDGHSLKNATLAGAGISANSFWSVHQEIDAGSLVRILPEYRLDDETALWLLYPKSNVLTPKVRVFIDFLRSELGPELARIHALANQTQKLFEQ